jgi:hypothetical protein
MILLSPSLFSLAFAGLGGQALKEIGLWRAERGTTLGVGLTQSLQTEERA